jgi:hypothetical protein
MHLEGLIGKWSQPRHFYVDVRATVDSIHRELQGTMKKLAAKGKMRPPAVATPAAMVN